MLLVKVVNIELDNRLPPNSIGNSFSSIKLKRYGNHIDFRVSNIFKFMDRIVVTLKTLRTRGSNKVQIVGGAEI